jgi:hypothetical protein
MEIFQMKLSEIEARREHLAAEYLALPNAWCARGLEIAEEFGRLAAYGNRERSEN